MRGLTVVVTAAGAPGGPGIIKSLREVGERKIRIIGTDARKTAAGLFLTDEAYLVPHGASPSYIDSMLKVAKKSKADIILPLSSMELYSLSKNKKLFEKTGIKVLVNEPSTLEVALDKRKSYDYLSKRGIPVPKYFLAHSPEDFREYIHRLGYPEKPVCFKPPVSKGQRGFRILREDIDLKKLLLETKPNSTFTTLQAVFSVLSEGSFPELLVMEYLPGPEYSVDSLTKDGRSIITIPRRRVETKLGVSSIGIVEKNKEVEDIAKKINEKLSLNYNINVQLKYSEEGVPKLVEINPRVSGTICLCTAAGVNLPYLAIKLAIGEEFSIPDIRWGTMMIRHWNEIYAYQPPSFHIF